MKAVDFLVEQKLIRCIGVYVAIVPKEAETACKEAADECPVTTIIIEE